MNLIFLRHGQTDWNVEHRLQGSTDVPLNAVGIAEARAAGKILSRFSFDAVYCSPLMRARQTLEYACPGAKPVIDERIQEWNFGPLEGQCLPGDFFAERWRLGQPPIEGVEQLEDLIARVSAFFRDLNEKHSGQTVLVVSHGGVSGAMYAAVYGVREGENLSKHCLPNATPVLFGEGQALVLHGEDTDD